MGSDDTLFGGRGIASEKSPGRLQRRWRRRRRRLAERETEREMYRQTFFTCQVQYLNDVDPFTYATLYPDVNPPDHIFSATLPLINQLAAVHRLLRAPHRVSHTPTLFAFLARLESIARRGDCAIPARISVSARRDSRTNGGETNARAGRKGREPRGAETTIVSPIPSPTWKYAKRANCRANNCFSKYVSRYVCEEISRVTCGPTPATRVRCIQVLISRGGERSENARGWRSLIIWCASFEPYSSQGKRACYRRMPLCSAS